MVHQSANLFKFSFGRKKNCPKGGHTYTSLPDIELDTSQVDRFTFIVSNEISNKFNNCITESKIISNANRVVDKA
jgi:hypothetical protein